jgi:hypothetical protein
MKCPGQDRGFWRENPAIEVPCPACGWSVELFRDESKGRCVRCGHRFPNPGADLGCARWCAMARQCVGFDPQRAAREGPKEGALAARLILRLQDEYAAEPPRLARALRTFQYTKERILQEKADPRVALVAALLAGADGDRGELLLAELELEPECRRQVAAIIEAIHAKNDLDSAEFRLVRAAWDQACASDPEPHD